MKILLCLPQFPFAHHGGAARSLKTMAEMMAAAGHQVHCVAITATERPCDIEEILSAYTYRSKGVPSVYEFEDRGILYRILETGSGIGWKHGRTNIDWRTPGNEGRFDAIYNHDLDTFRPNILLTYGAYPSDEYRYNRAKENGVKLVLGLRNFGYTIRPNFFRRFDGVVTCSQFLTDWYKAKIGIESTPLPLPIWPEDVIAESRTPIYFTAINPARRKGSMILETMFRVLHEMRPDIPLLIVGESTEPEFERLRQYATVWPWQANPKTIYAVTKVLLVPSVWEEPAGRVIVEAMMNGIPPIITDRGGMPEVSNYGAFVLPLDKRVTVETKEPVSLEVAQPWIDLVTALHDYPSNWAGSDEWPSTRAASKMYLPENLAPKYEHFFEGVACSGQIKQTTTGLANALNSADASC